jgi:hypothetical protein
MPQNNSCASTHDSSVDAVMVLRPIDPVTGRTRDESILVAGSIRHSQEQEVAA